MEPNPPRFTLTRPVCLRFRLDDGRQWPGRGEWLSFGEAAGCPTDEGSTRAPMTAEERARTAQDEIDDIEDRLSELLGCGGGPRCRDDDR